VHFVHDLAFTLFAVWGVVLAVLSLVDHAAPVAARDLEEAR
jgi:hypothetical protein